MQVSETSTQVEEISTIPKVEDTIGEVDASTVSPEVSPQKDITYLPPKSENVSDDSNMSEWEDEDEGKVHCIQTRTI